MKRNNFYYTIIFMATCYQTIHAMENAPITQELALKTILSNYFHTIMAKGFIVPEEWRNASSQDEDVTFEVSGNKQKGKIYLFTHLSAKKYLAGFINDGGFLLASTAFSHNINPKNNQKEGFIDASGLAAIAQSSTKEQQAIILPAHKLVMDKIECSLKISGCRRIHVQHSRSEVDRFYWNLGYNSDKLALIKELK